MPVQATASLLKKQNLEYTVIERLSSQQHKYWNVKNFGSFDSLERANVCLSTTGSHSHLHSKRHKLKLASNDRTTKDKTNDVIRYF